MANNNKIQLMRATARGNLPAGLEYGVPAYIKNVQFFISNGDDSDFVVNDYNTLINNPTGTANQVFGMSSTGTTREYKTLTGTSNQVIVSGSPGAITFSTPQDIHTAATPQFARLGIGIAAHASADLNLNNGTFVSNAAPTSTAYVLNTYWTSTSNLFQLLNNNVTKLTVDASGNVTAGKYNNITIAANSVGYSLSGGTTSKTESIYSNFTVGAAATYTGDITIRSSNATARTLTLATSPTINSFTSGTVLYGSAANTVSGMIGTANQLLGMNSGATLPEFKTLNGTTDQIIVAHASNAITLSLPQSIATTSTPQFARIGIGTAADGTANLKLNTGTILSNVADGSTAVGFTFNTPNYTTSGAKLVSFTNNTVEKAAIDKDGVYTGTVFASAGCYPTPTLVDNGNGSVTIGTSEYVFAGSAYPDGRGPYRKYSIAGNTFALTDNTMNYVIASYNGGSPTLSVTTNVAIIDESLVLPVYSIFRYGTKLSVQTWDSLAANLANKLHRSIVKTQRYRRQDGLLLTEQAGRYLTLTSGTVYVGAVEVPLAEINSSSTVMVLYYHSAGVWARSNISVYNNTQYDDGTNLQNTSINNYVVNWIFRGVISNLHMYVVLGTANYAKLSDAQAAGIPALPPEISSDGMLVAKIITQQGAATATEIVSAFSTNYTTAVAAVHNDLIGLQGGAAGNYQHANQGINTTDSPTWANVTINGVSQNNLRTIAKDPTGFDFPENVIVTYDSTTRTITLTGTFQGYWRGAPVPGLTTGWVSPAHSAGATTPLFLYYNGASFVWSTTVWAFDQLQIALVNYDAGGFRFALRETHGLMPWNVHQELHETTGTYSAGGGDISGFTLNSTTAANRRPVVSSTTIRDEDLTTIVSSKADSLFTRLSLSGAAATPSYAVDGTDIVALSGTQPYYNQFTGGAWTQTLLPNNSYMSIWLLAVPAAADTASQKFRYMWIQGQTANANLANEQALSPTSVYLSTLNTPEFIIVGRIIIRYAGGNWTLIQVDKITGTRSSQAVTTGGTYLTGVTTDSTLTGIGTVSSPLGVVGVSSPFTVGGTSVTTTAAQLNYLNASTGTTGNTNSNLVFSNAPTLVAPALGAATATSLTTQTVGITGLDSLGGALTSQLTWNQDAGTPQFTLQNGVTGQLFEETYVYGQAYEAISNGQVVMYGGVSGDKILFKKADMSAFGFRPEWILGVATQDFTTNQYGYVTWYGQVHDLNTSTWSVGDVIYADPAVVGGITNVAPIPPNPKIRLGIVAKTSATNTGILDIRIVYNTRVADITDVALSSLATDNVLIYDAATSTWKNSYMSLAKATLGGSTTSTAISITNATDSSNTTSGALVVSGGVGIAKNAYIGGDVVVSGNLTVNGSSSIINSTITTLDDPVITLGGDTAPAADDGKDRGVEYRWYNGSAKVGFFGFDRSTGKFTFIPDATNTSEVFSGTKGTIDANLEWADILSKPTTISGYGITDVGNGTLTLAVSGTGLSGSASFTANQAGNTTFTVTSNATSANTVSTVVARDASGNFAAGTITAALSGNASTATKLAATKNFSISSEATATAVAFDGSANVDLAVTLSNAAVIGKVLTGYTATSGTIAATDTILQAIQKLGFDKHVAVTLATNSGLTRSTQQLAMGTPSAVTGTSTNSVTTNTHTHALTTGYGDNSNPYASKTAKYVLAAPNAADGVPSFRLLLTSDISDLTTVATGITEVGTINTGVWNGTLIGPTYGGTGVNNGTNTLTLNGNTVIDATLSSVGYALYTSAAHTISAEQYLSPTRGGTGAGTFTANAIITGNGTSALQAPGPTLSATVLTFAGAASYISTAAANGVSFHTTNTGTTSIFSASPTINIGTTNTAAQTISIGTGVTGTTAQTIDIGGSTSAGVVTINSTKASSSSTTGALVVDGGLGVAGAIFAGAAVTTTGLVVNNGAADGGEVTFKSSGYTDYSIDNTNGTLRFFQPGLVRLSIDASGNTTAAGSLTAAGISSGGNITMTSGGYIYGPYGTMMGSGDEWLRINGDGTHTNGVYFGSSLVRTDGQLQVGSAGANFYANSSGNGYFSNSVSIGTTTVTEKLNVIGNISFGPSAGKVQMQYNSTESSIDFIIN